MTDFPLKAIVTSSYQTLLANPALLGRAAGLWVAVAIINSGLMMASLGFQPIDEVILADGQTMPDVPPGYAFLSLIDNLIALLGMSSVIIFWQRFVLLGENDVGLAAPVNRRVFRYIWASFLIGMLAVIPGVLLMGLLGLQSLVVVMVAILLILAFFTGRLIWVLAAVAMDREDSKFRTAWQLSAPYGNRLFLGVLSTIIPFYAIGLFAEQLISLLGFSFTLLAALLRNILFFAQSAVFAGFIALSYQFLEKQKVPAEA